MRHPSNHDLLGGILAAQLGVPGWIILGALFVPHFLILLLLLSAGIIAIGGLIIGIAGGLGAAVVLLMTLGRIINWFALAAGFDATARRRLRLAIWRALEPVRTWYKQGVAIAAFVVVVILMGRAIDGSTPDQIWQGVVGVGVIAASLGGICAFGWAVAKYISWIERRAKLYPRSTFFSLLGAACAFVALLVLACYTVDSPPLIGAIILASLFIAIFLLGGLVTAKGEVDKVITRSGEVLPPVIAINTAFKAPARAGKPWGEPH